MGRRSTTLISAWASRIEIPRTWRSEDYVVFGSYSAIRVGVGIESVREGEERYTARSI